MTQMNLSNTLWNDDSSGTIALVEQLKDRLLHTYIANNPNYSATDKSRIPADLKAELGVFQEKLNEFFLDHWVDFQRFLLDEGVDPTTIDSWKEVQEFLEGLPDDETMWLKNKLAALDTAIAGIDQDGIGIFDVSSYNNVGGTYATYNGLSAALAAIPTASKRSGMTIRYINSTSNQYEEYRYFLQYEDTTAGNAAFNNTANWQGIDSEPTAGSDNLVKSGGVADMYGSYTENPEYVYVQTDNEDKVLFGVKQNGSMYFGEGCPQQVKDYIEEKISSLSLDEYEDIVAFLSDYLGSDTTLKAIIDGIDAQIATKLNAEGLDPDALGTIQAVENPEYIQVTTDVDDKILEGITRDGKKKIMVETEVKGIEIGSTLDNSLNDSLYIKGYHLDKWSILHKNDYAKITPLLRLDGNDILLKKALYTNVNGNNYAIPCIYYDENKQKLKRDFCYQPTHEGTLDIVIKATDIPVSAAYIRCSLSYDGEVQSGFCNNINDLYSILSDGVSLSRCNEYIINSLAYRPLGELTKGYICFSADDGTSPAMSYTLPTVLQKDIPFTFMISSDSEIIQDDTYRAAFIGAVSSQNSKIFIGQHDVTAEWTNLTEIELYNFFRAQKDFFDSLGVEVKGAVPPTGKVTPIINTMMGGLYGVVRGYWAVRDKDGNIRKNEIPYPLWEYANAISSPRDNMFCLTSANLRDHPLESEGNNIGWKDIIDYAVANKRLVNIYIHDFDFVERYPEDTSKPASHTATPEEVAARKALFEAVIDYAKSTSIELISLGQITSIV